jgi:hypothetical protein
MDVLGDLSGALTVSSPANRAACAACAATLAYDSVIPACWEDDC